MQNDKQQGLLFLFFFSVEKIKRCISKPPSLRIEALLSWTKSTALSIKKKKKHGAAFFSFASLSLKQLLNRLSHISKLSHTHTRIHREIQTKTQMAALPFPCTTYRSISTTVRWCGAPTTTSAATAFRAVNAGLLRRDGFSTYLVFQQRGYASGGGGGSASLVSASDSFSRHSTPISSPSSYAEAAAAQLFEQTFGPSFAASAAVPASTTPAVLTAAHHHNSAQAEELFATAFGPDVTRALHKQHATRAVSSAAHSLTWPSAAAAVNATAAGFTSSDRGTAAKKTKKVGTPWCGLWELLARGRYAGVPSTAHAQEYLTHTTHPNRGDGSGDGAGHLAWQSSPRPPALPPHTHASSARHRAAPAPFQWPHGPGYPHAPFQHAPSSSAGGKGEHVHSAAAPRAVTSPRQETTATTPPPSAAEQRYWYSYRLWQSVHQHVQQEGAALEGFRAQMQRIREVQRREFNVQLRRATRWTFLVVMPLMTLLWLSIFLDTMVFRFEVANLVVVNYEAALEEYLQATGKKPKNPAKRGQKGKKSVKID